MIAYHDFGQTIVNFFIFLLKFRKMRSICDFQMLSENVEVLKEPSTRRYNSVDVLMSI